MIQKNTSNNINEFLIGSTKEHFSQHNIITYVSMTTIPIRLKNEWFYKNLKRTISLLPNNFKLILNLPDYSLKMKNI